MHVQLKALLGCYSNPARDARGHTVSAVYVGEASGRAEARDDAQHLGLFEVDNLPSPLAFDHGLILEDYRAYRDSGRVAPVRS